MSRASRESGGWELLKEAGEGFALERSLAPSSETGSRKGGKEEDKFAGGEGQSTGS